MNRLKKYRVLSALICLTVTLGLIAANVKANLTLQGDMDFNAIDEYVSEQMNDMKIPGLALGIFEDGQTVHLGSYGVADSSGRPVEPQTPFYLASVTKSFTALAVMQLVEEGKINLDAPVRDYLPWFALADKEATAKITVRNLLNHTSGISKKDGNRFWAPEDGLEESIRNLDTVHLTQPVGTAYQYSNINFGIAGLIVEEVSGQSYTDFVTEHIFEPLDMRHSYGSRASALADGLADGHHFVYGHPFVSERGMPPSHLPSGGLIASVEDMTHYAIAQLDDGRYGDNAILSSQGISELHKPAINAEGDAYYAMGWNVGEVDGKPAIWHDGDDGNFRSIVIMLPDRRSGIVLLANATGYEQMHQLPSIAKGVLNVLNGEPPSPVLSTPLGQRFLYWAIPVTLLLQLLGIALTWRNRQNIRGWAVLLTVIFNLAAIMLLFGLAQLIPFPFPSMLVFFPEIGYGLIAVATVGIGWSVIYGVTYLNRRRSKEAFLRMTGKADRSEFIGEHAS